MEENKDLNQQEEKVETEETVNDDAFTKTVENLKSAVEDVSVGIKNSVDSLVEHLKQVDIDKETITKYVNDFVSNVSELTDKASVKFNEIKNDPKTVEYLSKAKQTYDNVSQTVVKTATINVIVEDDLGQTFTASNTVYFTNPIKMFLVDGQQIGI